MTAILLARDRCSQCRPAVPTPEVAMNPATPSRPGARRAFDASVLTVALSLAFAVSFAPAARAQTFFVDNQSATCSNAGAGSEAEPYCTITAAMAVHRGPGITIIVKPGIYREQATIPASGALGSNFVIQASGPGVQVDGSDDFGNPTLSAPASGPVWLPASPTWTPLQVFADGARLTPSTAAPDLLPDHAFTWVSGQGLYLNLGGDNPGSHQALAGHRLHGFNIFSKSWVTIDGFEIPHVESRGVDIQSACTALAIS